MSGAEIGIAVIGAVAALITAYRDAGSIVENIKERRKAKGALPPSVALEESLEEGHQEIEKITAKGVQRFGTDFEQGDGKFSQQLAISQYELLMEHRCRPPSFTGPHNRSPSIVSPSLDPGQQRRPCHKLRGMH